MNARQKGERIFQETTRIAEKLRRRIKGLNLNLEDESEYRRAALFFFNKALKTYEAIRLLWKAGYEEDAIVLGRTLFELNMQIEWMSRDPEARSSKFFQHFPVRVYDLHRSLKSSADKIKDPETVSLLNSFDEAVEAHKPSHDLYRSNFIKKRGRKETVWENWWAGSIAELARWIDEEMQSQGEQGVDFEWEYRFVYFQECELAHTGTTSIVNYLKPMRGSSLMSPFGDPLHTPYSSSISAIN